MTKLEVQKRVLKNGEPLALHLFEWDEYTKTFSSNENGLVLDFKDISYCTFKTSSNCTFNTGWKCAFNTSYECVFNTSSDCTFNTDSECTFNTGDNCTFNTSFYCNFNIGKNSVIVRRDVFEVIALTEETNHIRLNPYKVKGYEAINDKVKILSLIEKKLRLVKNQLKL